MWQKCNVGMMTLQTDQCMIHFIKEFKRDTFEEEIQPFSITFVIDR